MLKLLFKGLLLLAAVFFSCILITRYDNAHKVTDGNALRLQAAEEIRNLDLLFVGPSYVYSGIIPAMFDSAGIRAFDLAVSTAGAFYTKELVANFLRSSSVQTICLSISYTTFSDKASDIWSLYPIHRYLNPPQSNEKIFMKYGDAGEYLQMIRNSVRKGVRNIGGKSELDKEALSEIKKTGGFATSSGTVTTAMIDKDKYLYLDYKKSVFSEQKVAAFTETIELCRANGVEVILIEPPTFQLKNYFEEEFIAKYNQLKQNFQSSLKIIECDSSWQTNSFFRNTDHLNTEGAKKYTAYLLDKFKQ